MSNALKQLCIGEPGGEEGGEPDDPLLRPVPQTHPRLWQEGIKLTRICLIGPSYSYMRTIYIHASVD